MSHVALTLDGRYLHIAHDGAESRLCADAETIDPSGVFERIELGHGRIALRTLDGRYLTRQPDPGQNFGLYPDDQLTPAAAFEEILWPNGQVSLRCSDLTYVGAGSRRTIIANRTEAGLSERFYFVDVPEAMIPAQRTRSSVRPSSAVPL